MTEPSSAARRSLIGRAFAGWLKLVRHMAPPTLFFFVGFNLILGTTRLALAEHGIDVKGFATATIAALLVGKAVLVTDSIRFMARFDGAPLIQPILFKSAIYWLCVFLVRLAEALVHYVIEHGTPGGFLPYLVDHFSWSRFLFIQVWLMLLFLLYVTIHELDNLFGHGELRRIFFRWNTTETKLTRRRRVRLLARLNRLTEANSVAAMSAPGSRPHDELVTILNELADHPKGKPRE